MEITREGEGAEPVFYFDFSSPFAYLAATRIDEVLPRRPRWAPVSMLFITAANERTPWSMRDESREPGKRECEQRAAEYGLAPMRWPSGWPVASYSLDALRAAYIAAEAGCLREFCRAAFERNFVAGIGLGTEADLRAVAEGVGLDPDRVVADVRRQEIKEGLKLETEAAIGAAVYGVPTVLVGGELFWGDDRLAAAAEACAA